MSGVLAGLAKERLSQPLPPAVLFRLRHDRVPAAPDPSLQSFLCRHSRKLENARLENHFHSVLRLRPPVSVPVPRSRRTEMARASRGRSESARRPGSAEEHAPAPLALCFPATATVRLAMNAAIPPSALPPESSDSEESDD
jgi:hypothetical protein